MTKAEKQAKSEKRGPLGYAVPNRVQILQELAEATAIASGSRDEPFVCVGNVQGALIARISAALELIDPDLVIRRKEKK